jgi:hypothetical protein
MEVSSEIELSVLKYQLTSLERFNWPGSTNPWPRIGHTSFLTKDDDGALE